MSGDQYSTRLDGKDRRRLERYRDEHDVTKAEALRHGVRELERRSSDDGPELVDQLSAVVRSWGTILVISVAVLLLSSAGVVPDIVQILSGILLIPALGYSWYVSWFRH
jgi:hypothetical protein